MELELPIVVAAIALASTIVAALLAYLFERSSLGPSMIGGFAAVAGLLCVAGAAVGGWFGLLLAIFLVTFLAFNTGRSLGKRRGSILLPCLWLGHCTSCAISYWFGSWLGILLITVPAWFVFWGTMYAISGRLLPLQDQQQSGLAFRSLITFSLGTNYPYQVLDGIELKPRVSGNPANRFFAGPGIVLTDAAHVPIIWNGLEFKGTGKPGITFTERLETVYQSIDLRPQLRGSPIEAITKDGIRVRVPTFFPFKLGTLDRQPELGASFPMDEDAIAQAIRNQPVELDQRRSWDEIVQISATRSLRKIIGEYEFDQLYGTPDDPDDSRDDVPSNLEYIRRNLEDQVRPAVRSHGIEIMGAGIGAPEPVDRSLTDKRIEAWRAEWERQIFVTEGESRVKEIWEMESAHTRAQNDLIDKIKQLLADNPDIRPNVLTNMAAMRFVEALEEMASQPQIRGEISDQTAETLDYLRRSIYST